MAAGGGLVEASMRARERWLDAASLSELPKLTGIPERTLRSYRLGQRRPPLKAMGAIDAALTETRDEREREARPRPVCREPGGP